MSTVIKVENLGKKYIIGHQKQRYDDSLRDTMAHTARGIWQRVRHPLSPNRESIDLEELWALKDVNFEVQEGERVGIIGANGAGKSTLLKILSRITEPTTGKVRIKGRVSSLLEVGTGFHPELTGRENIFLNGAILGMTRQEVKRKFDEIIAFAELEKFLDTPIKRYSSGMYVRLAFAVAAHLEPEILLVDEVLAVGDMSFQKKCLGKMDEVSKGGRTILFVSHNMTAMSALCDRAILLFAGRIFADGSANDVIDRYRSESSSLSQVAVSDRSDRNGNGRLRFTQLCFSTDDALRTPGQWISGRPGLITLSYTSPDQGDLKNVNVAVTFYNGDGSPLFVCDNRCVNADFPVLPPIGQLTCVIPRMPLAPGKYQVTIWASVSGERADVIRNAGTISVLAGDYYGTGRMTSPSKHGPFLVEHSWKAATSSDMNKP